MERHAARPAPLRRRRQVPALVADRPRVRADEGQELVVRDQAVAQRAACIVQIVVVVDARFAARVVLAPQDVAQPDAKRARVVVHAAALAQRLSHRLRRRLRDRTHQPRRGDHGKSRGRNRPHVADLPELGERAAPVGARGARVRAQEVVVGSQQAEFGLGNFDAQNDLGVLTFGPRPLDRSQQNLRAPHPVGEGGVVRVVGQHRAPVR